MTDSDHPTSAKSASRGSGLAPLEPLARVCGDVAGVLRRAWGRGPSNVIARWAGRDMVVVLMHDTYTDAERTLLVSGHGEDVVRGRRKLQLIVEDELKADVERILGRPVAAVLSATRLDPALSSEVFVLAEEPADGDESQLMERAGEALQQSRKLQEGSDALVAESRQAVRRSKERRLGRREGDAS